MSEQKIRYLPNGRIETLNETSPGRLKAIKWNARPNLNGSSPEAFKKAGKELHELGQKTHEKLRKSSVFDISHGRNYQTHGNSATAAYAADRARIEKIFEALRELEDIGLELYDIGGGPK